MTELKEKYTGLLNNKQIKLVIWDLDETFWQGTLSENSSGGGELQY